jgi:hypothetical protein
VLQPAAGLVVGGTPARSPFRGGHKPLPRPASVPTRQAPWGIQRPRNGGSRPSRVRPKSLRSRPTGNAPRNPQATTLHRSARTALRPRLRSRRFGSMGDAAGPEIGKGPPLHRSVLIPNGPIPSGPMGTQRPRHRQANALHRSALIPLRSPLRSRPVRSHGDAAALKLASDIPSPDWATQWSPSPVRPNPSGFPPRPARPHGRRSGAEIGKRPPFTGPLEPPYGPALQVPWRRNGPPNRQAIALHRSP